MILITGGGGLYGLNIAWYLANRGKKVLLLQRSPFQVPSFLAPFWEKEVKGIRGDIVSLPFLMGLARDFEFESIIHLAAVWEGRGGEVAPYQAIEVNIRGTVNVLEVARVFRLRRVTFASSNTVYHGMNAPPMGPYHEDLDLPAYSVGYIPCTKKAAEQICLLYAGEYKMSVCMVRGGRGYGPTMHWGRMPIERMVFPSLEGKPADLKNLPENNTLAPVHVKDLARGYGLLHLAESLKHTVYNISSGNSYTFSAIAQIVKEIIPGADIRSGPSSARVEPYCPSIQRAREDVGYIPEYADLREGIRAWIRYLKEGTY